VKIVLCGPNNLLHLSFTLTEQAGAYVTLAHFAMVVVLIYLNVTAKSAKDISINWNFVLKTDLSKILLKNIKGHKEYFSPLFLFSV
jgi:hypothetical protein